MYRKILLLLLFLATPAWAAEWRPTEAQMKSAEKTASLFVGALASGETDVAYNLLTPEMQKMVPKDQWTKVNKEFERMSGGGVKYSDVKASWYKDPKAPEGVPPPDPGVYAAFDMNCTYKKLPGCGETLILHEQKDGSFLVIRYERNIMSAKDIEKMKQQGNPEAGRLTAPY